MNQTTALQSTLPAIGDDEVRIKILNLMQNSEDLIYFKDLNSVFTLCSDSLTLRLGQGRVDTLVGKSDFDFFDAECAQKFFEGEQEIIRTGKPIIGQDEMEVRNGVQTWVFTTKMPLKDEAGNILGTFGISRDITAHKQTELKLKQTNEQLVEASRRAGMAEIATDVIHNVGNVLNSINVAVAGSKDLNEGFEFDKIDRVADLVEQSLGDKDFYEEKAKIIPGYLRGLVENYRNDQEKIKQELTATRRHLDHIRNIITQQQEYATASRIIEEVDLSELINDAIQMSSRSLENHGILLIRDFEEGLTIETDKHRVLQIIVNLIRNAKHACVESGAQQRQICVSIKPSDAGGLLISVSDNGVGIAKENLVKLFSYGFTTRQRGKGFGLHSGANSAQSMGGSLTAHSDGPGKGATFVLELPRQFAS